MPRWVAFLLLPVLLGAALGGCRRTATPIAPPGPQTPRIAALAPAIGVILRDLGYDSCIVARHGFDTWTNPGVPVAGDQAGIDYEALLRSKPTHVLLQWGERPLPSRLIDLGLEHKWEIKSYPLLTLDDIRAAIIDLGGRFRPPPPQPGALVHPAPNDALARWDRALTFAGGLQPEKIGKVLILYGTAPPAALGPGSYHHQILERLGARSVFAAGEGSPYVPLDSEDLIRVAPDAIIVVQPRADGAAPAAPIPADASLAGAWLKRYLGALAGLPVPAIERRRVSVIDHPLGLIPGTNLVDVAEEMRRQLIGWSHDAAPSPAAP